MDFENRNYALAGAFIDELARCGLEHVCICPGSRSSPLAIAFARHPGIRTWVHLDERSASFFALGMARATGKPVALVCSSGTASANFFPAVVEARYGSVPLLALTADRPPEMVDWGALQTIDQTRMYGSHVKWSVNMPPPEATTEIMSYTRSVACRAYFSAGSAPAGPIHVDFPFREPLEPVATPSDFPASVPEQDMAAWHGREDGRPFVFSPDYESRPRLEDIQQLAADLAGTERGLIVCGPQNGSMPAEAVTELAWKLGYPLLADALSGLRCGPHDRSLVIDNYDAFIRDDELADSLAPKLVIRLGRFAGVQTAYAIPGEEQAGAAYTGRREPRLARPLPFDIPAFPCLAGAFLRIPFAGVARRAFGRRVEQALAAHRRLLTRRPG